MAKRIYVGNLPFSATDDEVRSLVARLGTVASMTVDRRRGVAEVVFDDEIDARSLDALRGAELGGNRIDVAEDRPS